MNLNGQRIVVLGGTSGIGLATAQAASREGAAVVVVSSRQARVEEALAALPSGAEGHAVDLGDPASVAALFAEIGAFDHLVYTAGENLQLGSLVELDATSGKRFFDIRFWGAILSAKQAAAHLRPGGSITFTSGIASQRPHAGWAMGAAVTSAMEGLTRALAVELAPLRVNIVSPGVVRTPLWASMSDTDRDALYQQMDAALLVGHVGEAEEVAKAYLYCMHQTYGTGQVIVVDGGGLLV